MVRSRIYLDTTIPSYAVERRADLVARYGRGASRRLLGASRTFEFLVSPDELEEE
ncbi:MAG: hypothetical protein QME96_06090 [Myxococcota bacterium]|nr:hypothetical protein [Myxococcota bacterium]